MVPNKDHVVVFCEAISKKLSILASLKFHWKNKNNQVGDSETLKFSRESAVFLNDRSQANDELINKKGSKLPIQPLLYKKQVVGMRCVNIANMNHDRIMNHHESSRK